MLMASPPGWGADMATIPNNRIPEFAEAIAAAFNMDEIESLCLQAVNEDLYMELAKENDTRVKICMDLLTGLQQRGTEKDLLAIIYAERPGNLDIKTLIESVYATVLNDIKIRKPSRTVSTGLDVLIKLLGVTDGKAVIEKSRTPIEKVARNVSYMAVYKNLHDCLHQLQIKPYFELRDATDTFATDRTQQRILFNYRTEVQNTLAQARGSIADLPPDETEILREEIWIGDLETCSKAYNTAFDEKNSADASTALMEINRILANVPVRLNEEIMMKAKTLPIEELSGIIEAISSAIGASEAKIVQAQESMRALGPSITARVKQHKLWQDTDRIIAILDTVTDRKGSDLLAGFRMYWPKVKDKIKILIDTEAGAAWTTECAKYTLDLDDQVAKEEFSPDLQFAYETLRGSTRAQFFAVDANLKMDCSALSRMSAPLLRLLETTING
jgi:hypothetical protein